MTEEFDPALPAEQPNEAEWEARLAAVREECAEEARRAAEENAQRITALENELTKARTAAARRETEIRCTRMLRERALDEAFSAFLVTPEETELTDETLEERVGMLAQAVETAAARLLQERAGGMRPGCGEAAPLSAQMICRTPVARLAEMMGEEG
jgi:hypothetical protein